jgi:hypothetical protein
MNATKHTHIAGLAPPVLFIKVQLLALAASQLRVAYIFRMKEYTPPVMMCMLAVRYKAAACNKPGWH